MNAATNLLARELNLCRAAPNPMDRFNSVVLQRPPYWRAQRAIGRALNDPSIRRICVKSGHMTGKSFSAGGFAHGWLAMYADSGVAIVGPSLDQVKRAVWKEVRKARAGSPLLRNVGRLTRAPMELVYDEGWQMVGLSGTEPERLQGFHPSGPVLVVVDEASGVNDPDVNQALDSLKPVKRLDISNPLWPHGEFYDACQRAVDDPSIKVIEIPSTDSPDIHLEHSPRGLADAAWHRGMILDYGITSQVYRTRVGAQFPNDSADQLIPRAWLDAAERASHRRAGPIRLAIDLGLGRGGDDSVFVVRDDNGFVPDPERSHPGWEASKFLSLAKSAEVASRLVRRYSIAPQRVTYDAEGIGADFGGRLEAQGIVGAVPYQGKRASKSKQFERLRTACHFHLRWRLDPDRPGADGRPQPPFAIPRDFMARLRRECRELTFDTNADGRTVLRLAEDVADGLGFSPDFSVTLAQSFAFPNS